MGLAFAGPVSAYLFARKRGMQTTLWADAGDSAGLSAIPQEITFESRQLDGWNTEKIKSSAWLVRSKNGQAITAFSPVCTHLGCAYHWETDNKEQSGGCFVCPCHGSRFDVNGLVLNGPAVRPLDRYATKLQGSRLWILPATDSNG